MGTRARVVLYAQSEGEAAAAAGRAFEEMSRLEAVMSDYRPDSEAMLLTANRPGQWHPISTDLKKILELSRSMYEQSDGAFDVTIGPLTRSWREARKTGRPIPEPELARIRTRVGFPLIELDHEQSRARLGSSRMILDFGGIGKGYAAQEAVDLLSELGHARCLVEIGGDLVVGDPPPGKHGWRITIETGLADVDRETRVLHNVGVATSGDAEQFIEFDGVRYSHILNPITGLGVTERIAVTVIANDGATADAAASAISVMGAEPGRQLAERLGVEVVIVVGD